MNDFIQIFLFLFHNAVVAASEKEKSILFDFLSLSVCENESIILDHLLWITSFYFFTNHFVILMIMRNKNSMPLKYQKWSIDIECVLEVHQLTLIYDFHWIVICDHETEPKWEKNEKEKQNTFTIRINMIKSAANFFENETTIKTKRIQSKENQKNYEFQFGPITWNLENNSFDFYWYTISICHKILDPIPDHMKIVKRFMILESDRLQRIYELDHFWRSIKN